MPKASVSHSSCSIPIEWSDTERRTIVEMVRILLALLPGLIAQLIKKCQITWLKSDLGPYGTAGNLFGTGRLACPEWGSVEANRKHWRTRSWTVLVLGTIECPIRWVECRDCGRSWTPYKRTLGIKDPVQYSPEVMVGHLQEALQATYRKASNESESSPSPMTIGRRMMALFERTSEGVGRLFQAFQPWFSVLFQSLRLRVLNGGDPRTSSKIFTDSYQHSLPKPIHSFCDPHSDRTVTAHCA